MTQLVWWLSMNLRICDVSLDKTLTLNPYYQLDIIIIKSSDECSY